MSRTSKIRWRDEDYKEIARSVKNFNAKIDYQMKHHPERIDALPQKQKIKEVINNIATRKDLNREINSMKRFSKRNATDVITNKQGLKTTRWEKNETSRKLSIVNQKDKRDKILKGNRPEDIKPVKLNFEKKTAEDWKTFTEWIDKHTGSAYDMKKAAEWKYHYLKAIEGELKGTEYGMMLYQYIDKLSPDEIYSNLNGDPMLHIDFIYDQEQADEAAAAILERWEEATGKSYDDLIHYEDTEGYEE